MKTLTRLLLLTSLIVVGGCFSKGPEAEFYGTKSWENHYRSVEDFRRGTATIELEKGESIWVISNRTLSRTLKNVSKAK